MSYPTKKGAGATFGESLPSGTRPKESKKVELRVKNSHPARKRAFRAAEKKGVGLTCRRALKLAIRPYITALRGKGGTLTPGWGERAFTSRKRTLHVGREKNVIKSWAYIIRLAKKKRIYLRGGSAVFFTWEKRQPFLLDEGNTLNLVPGEGLRKRSPG